MTDVISIPGLMNAIISGNLLMTTVTGPMSVDRMLLAANASAPLLVKLASTHNPWGSILVIENDASFFTDSTTEYIKLITTNAIYANRKKMAFVIAPGVIHSEETMLSLSTLVNTVTGVSIQMFSDPVEAIRWASDL